MQQALQDFKDRGLGVAAVSYDSTEVLSDFSRRRGITYSLISDPKSKIIRDFGLINTQISSNHPYFGIPFPGILVIDSAGVVTGRYFEEDYKARFTAHSILARTGVPSGPPVQVLDKKQVKLSSYVSDARARPGQRISIVVEAELPAKMHLYAPGVQGYRQTRLSLKESPYFTVHAAEYPKPEMLYLEAIEQTVPVYRGKVRMMRDITLTSGFTEQGPPHFILEPGRILTLEATFEYQACDDTRCYLPEKVPLEFHVEIERHDLDRVPKAMRKAHPVGRRP